VAVYNRCTSFSWARKQIMDQTNAPALKVVDFNTSEREHYEKCTQLTQYNGTIIFSFAQQEPYEYAPGAPVEQVLMVRKRISIGLEEARDLYEMLHEVLQAAGLD
jgi:hypothetical protein